MLWILDLIIDLLQKIERDQIDHLRKNVQTEMIDNVIETSTFNNEYIDATRAIKKILRNAHNEIDLIIKHYNNT